AKGHHALGTAPDYDPLGTYVHQHHLSFAQLTLVAGRPVPALDGALPPGSRIGKAMVHPDLVAVAERAAHPYGEAEKNDAAGHYQQLECVRLGNGILPVHGDDDETDQH